MEKGRSKQGGYRLSIVNSDTRLLSKHSNSIHMTGVGHSEKQQRSTRRTAPLSTRACSVLLMVLSIAWPGLIAAQTEPLSFSVQFNDTPLREALAELKSQHDIKLAYDDLALADIRITKAFQNLALPAAIEALLSNTNLVYRILGQDKVLIRPQALAEKPPEKTGLRTLNGRVIDPQTGEGLAFATVTTLDGKRGTIADENGAFVFQLSDQKNYLRVQ